MRAACLIIFGVLLISVVQSGFSQVPPERTDVSTAVRVDAETVPEDAVDSGMTWQDTVRSGGSLMYVLGLMSVITLALVIYFSAVLRMGQVVPQRLYGELTEKVRSGMMEEALRICEYSPCPLSSVVSMAIGHKRNNPAIDPVLLKDIVESEGERQADGIQGQTQYLMDLGVIAPMVGLLGTVIGMLNAFSGVALNSALSKPVVLADGVSKALITTAAGLMVAIPAMIAYAYFRRKAARLVSHLEAASTEILAILVNKGI